VQLRFEKPRIITDMMWSILIASAVYSIETIAPKKGARPDTDRSNSGYLSSPEQWPERPGTIFRGHTLLDLNSASRRSRPHHWLEACVEDQRPRYINQQSSKRECANPGAGRRRGNRRPNTRGANHSA